MLAIRNVLPRTLKATHQTLNGRNVTKWTVRTCATSSAPSRRNGIVRSDFDVPLINQDICTYLFSRWEKWPEKDAFECVTTGRKLTYEDLLKSCLRWGSALKRLIPESAQLEDEVPVVSIFSPNVIEYGAIVIGSLAAGCTTNTVNSHYTTGELSDILKDVKPRVLVVHSSLEDTADEAVRALKLSIPVVVIGPSSRGNPNIQEILENPQNEQLDYKEVDPTSPALILYSGGTTGLPKGVVLPHSSVTNNVLCFTDPRIHIYGRNDYYHCTVTALMPFFHVYGMVILIMMNLSLGSKILVFEEFEALKYGSIIEKHKIQFLHLVPTLLNFIVNSGQVTSKQLASLKGVIIGAAPVLPNVARALQDMTSPDLVFQEGFGMTEVLGTHLTPKNSARIGFCGKLVPNAEAKIIDLETKEVLGPDQKGEMLIRCPFRMSHYLNNPEITAETIDEEGWVHTGDVAMYTEDGYFSIVDRLKDIMKVKGYQVSPAEIEDILMKHEAVADVGVVGIPDERYGERPRAYVTLKGNKKGLVAEEELIKHVEKHLSAHKRLTGGVRFIEQLPTSGTGKILRKELKKIARKDIEE